MFKLIKSSDIEIGGIFIIVSNSKKGKYLDFVCRVKPDTLFSTVELFNNLDGLVSDECYFIPCDRVFDILPRYVWWRQRPHILPAAALESD